MRKGFYICISIVLSNSVYATDFNRSVIFGDSLSDGGNLGLATLGEPIRFTTNPGKTAAEYVANTLGSEINNSLLGGDNYAWGGATVSDLEVNVPNLQQQLDQYLFKNNGQAKATTLYQVWGGSNDIFNLVKQYQTQEIDIAQVQNSLLQAANQELNLLKKLKNTGAQYVVVYNLPNIGLTPEAMNQGASASAFLSQLSNAYNQQLNAGLDELSTKNYNIISINVSKLLDEVIENPIKYGFKNATGTACGGSSLGCTENSNGYVFADGVHPTVEIHRLLADATLATIYAPQQISLLAEVPSSLHDAKLSFLRQEVFNNLNGANTRALVNIHYDHQKIDSSKDNPNLKSNNTGVNAGLNYRYNPNISIGATLGFDRQNGDFGESLGDYKLDEISGQLYGVYQQDKYYISAYTNIGFLDYKDIRRQIKLGLNSRTHNADTKAKQYGISLETGYQYKLKEELNVIPFVNLDLQKTKVDGYKEQDQQSTALWFDDIKRTSLISSLGARLQGNIDLYDYKVIPLVEISWKHEFKDDAIDVRTGSNTVNGSFQMQGYQPEKNWGDLTLGFNVKVNPQWSTWMNVSTLFAHKDKNDINTAIGLSYNF